MLDARFGDVALGITSLDHEGGQDWATSSPTSGDRHTLQPRGLRQRRTPCRLAFVGPDFEARWRAFDELADSDQARLFVHPLRGSYLAVVEDWRYSVSEVGDFVEGSCTFIEYAPPLPPSPVAASSSAAAGAAGVRIAADNAIAAATAAGTTFEEAEQASANAEEWSSSDGLSAREVQATLDATLARIDDRLNALKPSNSAEWQLFKSMLRVRYQLQQSAAAVLAEGESVTEFLVETGTPLIAIAVRLFGGADARQRAEDLRRLNNLRTPGMVPAGTRLKVPQ